MDLNSIITLIKAVSDAKITNFQVEEGNFKLTMDKLDTRFSGGNTFTNIPAPAYTINAEEKIIEKNNISYNNVPKSTAINEEIRILNDISVSNTVNAVVNEDLKDIKSPIVGTFYSASGPDASPFVKVGDIVKKGQVLCIIEAMKLMNDIESDYDGEIVEILVKNDQMVEYNQPLFKIREV